MLGREPRFLRRPTNLGLACLSVFLLLLPLTISKPGLPPVLKADEAAFYLGALSLWHDGDLECEEVDVRRLFREYSGTSNLLLMRGGEKRSIYFSVPFVYPLVSAPFVGSFGANGMVLLNSALLVAMLWMGVSRLRRYNPESLSLLFALGFFLLSTAFVYVFWLQAEILNMAFVMTAYFLVERGARRDGKGAPDAARNPSRRFRLDAALAAVLLAAVAYGKPMFVLLAVPLLYLLLRFRSWSGVLAFAAAGIVTAGVLCGSAWALTGEVWPYFAPRASISVSSPVDYLERRVEPRLSKETPKSAVGQIASSGEVMRVTVWKTLREALPEFLFGRHGGLIIYMPFAVLAVALFLLNEPRSPFAWLVLASAMLVALLFVMLVRGQWLGGGGFIGNRYFTTVYPAFFFIFRRIRPAWATVVGYAAAAIFLGPLILTPLGAQVPEPTLQAHARNQPYPRLPFEWSLFDSLSGYETVAQRGLAFHGRADELAGNAEEVWVQGSKKVDLNLLSRHPLDSFVFDVRSGAPDNRIEICLESDCRTLDFDNGQQYRPRRRVTFEAPEARPIPRTGKYGARYRYRMTVETEWGEQPRWRGASEDRFYLGAALAFLGSAEDVGRDLFRVEWLSVDAPAEAPAGETLEVPVELRNASRHTWPGTGSSRVRLGYHWLSPNGEAIIRSGKRTELPGDVEAGERVAATMLVQAPDTTGRLILELDLVRERVGWFSTRRSGQAQRIEVQLVPSGEEIDVP